MHLYQIGLSTSPDKPIILFLTFCINNHIHKGMKMFIMSQYGLSSSTEHRTEISIDLLHE